ncbi:acyl-CoA sterol acyl transferase 1 [Actinidia rufa]|uniref:Acyl-CoA sterol acyl transferase 1 n=1 Tax=Actinidia rufa TaxID=165716 RepID=A0A7J0EZ33_9ERIC|nr:acyl-CoA sterol acyl transferase 1 [Actinidia rufa]
MEADPSHGRGPGSIRAGVGARATVQRPLPLDLAPGLLGAAVEYHGHAYPAPARIRSGPERVDEGRGPEVGPASCRVLHLRGVGHDARAHILLLWPEAAHLGDDLVFPAPRAFGCSFQSFFGSSRMLEAFEEYALVGAFLKDLLGGAVKSTNFNATIIQLPSFCRVIAMKQALWFFAPELSLAITDHWPLSEIRPLSLPDSRYLPPYPNGDVGDMITGYQLYRRGMVRSVTWPLSRQGYVSS